MKQEHPPRGNADQKLVDSLDRIHQDMVTIPKEYDHIFHPGKHLFLTFLRGIVSGLGVLASVAIVVPLILAMMRGIEWVPLLGDFVAKIADQVDKAR